MADHGAQIRELLAESIGDAQKREASTFEDQRKATDGSIVLFGAGRLGRLCARALKRARISIAAFCDNDRARWSETIEDVRVLPPSEAAERFGRSSLFVVATWSGTARESMCERLDFLRRLGCAHVEVFAPLAWTHRLDEHPFHAFESPSWILAHAAKIHRLAGLLADSESRRILLAVLRQRLKSEFDPAPPNSDQYFPADLFTLTPEEIVVDAGAFDGDTLHDFLSRTHRRFREYHAFEPDRLSAERFRAKVAALPEEDRQRIRLYELALHAKKTCLGFAAKGTPDSGLDTGAAEIVEAVELDRVLTKPITFLKLDVEGTERDVLRGANRLLAESKPIVAASVYHRPDDLWEIPLQLNESLPADGLFLRQHGFDGWETVCYAVPPWRMIARS